MIGLEQEQEPSLTVISSHILLCNVLTIILRPNFEEPLDTSKQLVEEEITLYMWPGTDGWREWMLESNNSEYKILAKTLIYADDWDHFDNMSMDDVLVKGTHALLTGYLTQFELDMGRWYRSKEKFEDDPYFVYLSNKKWHLNEVTTLHYIILQKSYFYLQGNVKTYVVFSTSKYKYATY